MCASGKGRIMAKCKLCGSACEQLRATDALVRKHLIRCPCCGEYVIADDALLDEPEAFVRDRFHLVSAVARRLWEGGQRFQIDTQLFWDRSEFEARVLSTCPKNTQEKAHLILVYLAEHSSRPGETVMFDTRHCFPLFCCKNEEELLFFVKSLVDLGIVHREQDVGVRLALILSLDGWRRVEELRGPNAGSTQAVVVTWLDDELDAAYAEGIARLQDDTGFSVLRINMKPSDEKIRDRTLAEIRRSRFLIADVTGHRQGVYFEAGFAMGLGLPLIWTCHKDRIDQCHFDPRQFNHVTWETSKDLQERLRDRILTTIGNPAG